MARKIENWSGESDSMKYKKSVVVFLDVLGFKKLVSCSARAEEPGRILALFRRFSTPDKNTAFHFRQFYVGFSDLCVRIRYINAGLNRYNPYGIVFFELLDLLHLQLDLLANGIFIRGAMTIGDVFLSRQHIYGPGLISAYDLESTKAKYPRILVDKQILLLMKKNSQLRSADQSYDEEIEFIKKLIKRDYNGLWFLDYLRAAASEVDDEHQYIDFIRQHKELVQRGILDRTLNAADRRKYYWLRNYHNTFIGTIPRAFLMNCGIVRHKLAIA